MAKNNKDRKTMSSEMGIPSGLNPIKTRSGPLKDVETYTIGIRSLDASLTSQQLSNMSGAESRSQNRASTKDFSAAPPTQTAPRATSSARPGGEMIIADIGKSSGQHLKGKISHRFAAYLDKECSRNIDSFPKDSENYNVAANNLNQKDVVGEKPPQQSFQKKKFPKGFKSYSHELGPRGGMRPVCPRAHSDNDLKELLGALHARFNTAKEEVNSELAVFAGDVVEVLEKKDSLNPEWQENIEDLLILARECAVMPPTEFRRQCEGIVQDLEDKRQQLPVGLLKQLHTHMLFILTRCTRLLQFQKESGPNQEDSIHKFKQCLKGVPSVEMGWVPSSSKKSKVVADSAKFRKHEDDLRNRIDGDELTTSSGKQTVGTDSAGLHDVLEYSITTHRFPAYSKNDSLAEDYIGLEKKMTSLAPQGQIKSPETYTVDPSELLANTVPEDKPFVVWDENSLSQESGAQSCSPSKQQYKATWGFVHDQQANIEELESVICRICEEEVPTSHLESHSYICAYADRCDLKGLNVDERLAKMAETLEQIVESCRVSLDSPETTKVQNVHSTDGFESYSPRLSDWHRKGVEGMFEDLHEIDTASIEESRIPSSNNLKGHFALRFEQGFASSSAGSVTPRSAINTPRANQIDLFWLERSNLTEAEDVAQMTELADIARCVASTNPKDEGATEYLTACMQDLQDILQHSKVEALVVETFGSRIEKLLREKYLLACETLDHKSFDPSSTLQEDEGSLADEGSHSIMSTPAHPAHKERTSIDDFEIIKPISRGAFGKVFLARKRTTGDLFAIKVLRKVDMIRKNAVESILAERNILITVRNPFVVRFFYSFTCRDNLYLVMEYLNGGDLYSLLRNVGCLEEEIARIYIAELVLALEYLHSLGIVHRDLKPDNILIAHDGHIKLTDFGLSKFGLINSTEDLAGPGASGSMLLGDHSCQSSSENVHYREQRKQRSAVGTPDYLAPEILLGTEHGYTADWWSTGIILFEILTGIPPFSAEHPQIIFDKILNRKIPWPRVPDDMSYEAKDLIDKLLTEDPNLRLGAKGASEVKAHPFFDNVNWDTLAMQKAAFVPSPESADDTSYFTCRPSQNSYTIQEYPESSDCSTSTTSSNSLNIGLEEGVDECGDLTEFDCPSSVKYTFSNFSFKNLSQLALINYDLLLQSGKDSSKSSSPSKGPES